MEMRSVSFGVFVWGGEMGDTDTQCIGHSLSPVSQQQGRGGRGGGGGGGGGRRGGGGGG